MSANALPAGWSAVSILDAAGRIMDFRGRTPKKLGMSWGGGDIPAISARNVRMGCIDFTEEFYLGSDALYRKWMTHGGMERGDILITTEAPLGNVAAVPDERRYILSQRTVLIRPKRNLFDKTFFLKALQSPAFQRLLTENATGSTALGIQRRRLERLEVVAPPVDEQHRIGQALQNVDDLIAALERTIAKKRAVKQGMMQQLLTGHTLLPGHRGRFEERRLSSVAIKIQDGTHFSPTLGGSDYRYITSRNIGAGEMRLNHVETISSAEHKKIYARCDTKFGDLLLTKDGANTGNAALNPFRDEISLLSSVAFIRCDPRAAVEGYLMQYILSHQGRRQIQDAMAGNAITRLTLAKIRNFVVPLPDVVEQQAIARILGDADTEISSLRVRLAKARAVRTGMMQQLLTGRTRLPVAEGAA